VGAEIEAGTTDLDTLDGYALGIEPPVLESGRQEMLENLLNDYI
jgi:xylose isomerase